MHELSAKKLRRELLFLVLNARAGSGIGIGRLLGSIHVDALEDEGVKSIANWWLNKYFDS